MRIDLSGKNALVTGGASGIGRECAQVLAEAGAQVAVVDIRLADAEQIAVSEGLAIRCDVTDPESVSSMQREVAAKMGTVDILVNCAGIISFTRGIKAVPIDEWDRVLAVNLKGTYLVCRELIEPMKEQRSGKIVMVSSLAARVGGIEVGIHYTASKAALIGFTRSLAKECGEYGINVNAVAPGFTATASIRGHMVGAREERYIAQTLLKRMGQPRDVANAVLFLASPLSDYITGITLDVNGGVYMG